MNLYYDTPVCPISTANDLIQSGHRSTQAIMIAVNHILCKRWKNGSAMIKIHLCILLSILRNTNRISPTAMLVMHKVILRQYDLNSDTDCIIEIKRTSALQGKICGFNHCGCRKSSNSSRGKINILRNIAFRNKCIIK